MGINDYSDVEEVWQDIDGYEGFYRISNFGRIISLPRNGTRKTPRILKRVSDKRGYEIVILSKNGIRKTYKTHRLVAQTFIPNPNNLPQINHKNEIKTDNNVYNLEWCDSLYNVNYGTRIEKVVDKRSKQVCMFDKDNNYIKTYKNGVEASKETGISKHHINSCCHKRYGRKTAGGYIWKYKTEVVL